MRRIQTLLDWLVELRKPEWEITVGVYVDGKEQSTYKKTITKHGAGWKK